jgi:biotin operon repressor
MKVCVICGRVPAEQHHIVKRSQNKAMIKAPINHIYLCDEHHRGTFGVHGREGHKLDMKLKMELQKKLFKLFDREHYSKKELKELLGISKKNVDILVKMLKHYPKGYDRVDIVRACMGGILYAD